VIGDILTSGSVKLLQSGVLDVWIVTISFSLVVYNGDALQVFLKAA
jgi:hypothetical protein